MPLVRRTGSTSELFAAMCLDVTSGGNLDSYFDFGGDKFSAAYFLFNVDAAFKRGLEELEISAFKKSFDELLIERLQTLSSDVSIK